MLSPMNLIRVGKIAFSSSSRTFAISLLDQLSISQLQSEARGRSLTPSGSKATLITRIKHVENREDSADSANSIYRRDSSTVNHSKTSAASPSYTALTLNVKLPDLSAPRELPDPHIPFLPDFWDSSRSRGADAIRHDVEAEAPMRKVLVVGGTSMQHAGGPTYGESDHTESGFSEDQTISKAMTPTHAPGFWADVAEDIGLPPSLDTSSPLANVRAFIVATLQDSAQETRKPTPHQRPLDPDEVKGIWVLLLILGGSWLAGGLLDGSKNRKLSFKA